MKQSSDSPWGDDPEARPFERLAYAVAMALPELRVTRTTEAIQLSGNSETGATLLFTPEALEVRLPTVDWVHGAYGARASTRLLRRYLLRQLLRQDPEDPMGSALLRIQSLFRDACATRRKEFRKCRYCGESYPPEFRHARDVCHGCAEIHLGVVH